MQLNAVSKSFQLPDGREVTIETGKLARQADGSVVVRMGDTMLLATVVSKIEPLEGADFLPLSVDYQEKFASAGRIPGGFLRREGRLGDHEILISRLIDRALRPMFPDDYHADTQVMISLVSVDKDDMPDGLAALAASSALAVSDIPFNGPISEVRVARVDGQFLVNPRTSEIENADLELIVAADLKNVIMVEGEMKEVAEEVMLEAIKVAHEAIKVQCQAQIELAELVGSTTKREYSHEVHDLDLKKRIEDELYDKVYEVVARKVADKKERSSSISAIYDAWVEGLGEEHEVDLGLAKTYFKGIHKKAARNLTLNERVRLDGRQLDEVRPIWCETDYLPMAHGSSLFTRGETQSLTSVTLGTKLDEQLVDTALRKGTNKFLLHYNFPGFSTGEVRPNRGPGRREVGHGNLALRALKQVVPADADNPYTIRVVSDILESNGSSSMATVCAGSMALMDAGIPTSGAVSGIAMGMISDPETGKFAVLSDILGDEDHLGDMDFKVAGTAKGLTATQMDIKVDGLSYEVLSQALEQSKQGRLHILGKMNEAITQPRADLKSHAPRSVVVKIEKDMIGAVIGPGGKIVQEIQKETNTTVVIEETETHGTVNIFATNQEDMDNAVNRVKAIASLPEVGEVYTGKVKSIMPFGAFIEFMPNRDGLLHISEIKWERVETMDGVMEVGEVVEVKLIDVDKKTGKYRLSRKALLPRPERQPRD